MWGEYVMPDNKADLLSESNKQSSRFIFALFLIAVGIGGAYLIAMNAGAASSAKPQLITAELTLAPIAAPAGASVALDNAFADYAISSKEGKLITPSLKLYYLHFAPGTVNGNAADIYVLTDGNFIRKKIGYNVDGDAIQFAPKKCADASNSDFSPSNFFSNSPGVIEIKGISSICAKDSSGIAYDIGISALAGTSVTLTQ